MTRDDSNRNREAGLDLLRLGLMNLSEVAECAGVSRQAVQKWAKSADLDWKKARTDLVHKLWHKRIRGR